VLYTARQTPLLPAKGDGRWGCQSLTVVRGSSRGRNGMMGLKS